MDIRRLALILLGVGAFLLAVGFGNWLSHRPSYSRVDASGGGIFEGAANDWASQAEAAYRSCLYSSTYSGGLIPPGSTCESSPVTPIGIYGGFLLLAAGGVLLAARRG